MLPTISIITPTYNRASFLKRMIKSVLEQNSQEWSLIILDNGSTDDTEKVVKAFNDLRITYLDLKHSSVGDKRNEGIRRANSKYITFLDSDDEAMPNWIYEFQLKILENYGFISCGYERIIDKTSRNVELPKKMGDLNFRINFKSGTLCIQKKFLQEIGGFDPELPAGLNTDLILKLLPFLSANNLPGTYINESLIRVYEHTKTRIRNDNKAVLFGTLSLLEKHKFWFEKNPEEYKNYLGVIGVCFAKERNFKKGREFLIKAFKIKPCFKSGLRITLISIPYLRNKIWKIKKKDV